MFRIIITVIDNLRIKVLNYCDIPGSIGLGHGCKKVFNDFNCFIKTRFERYLIFLTFFNFPVFTIFILLNVLNSDIKNDF